MVSRDVMLRCALRYDTAMSRAMLRALGREAPRVRPRPCPAVRVGHESREARRYRDLMACFRNHGSPMDRMR